MKVSTRRRDDTRAKLLEATLDVFAERGFGHSTVEQVCERAGFTRGAFYSNFSSLDELFFAMWEQQSTTLMADLERTAAEVVPRLGSASDPIPAIVDAVLGAVSLDSRWFRVDSEFTAHALRDPDLLAALSLREDVIARTIARILTSVAEAMNATIDGDPALFARALVAVHDGTRVQCVVHPATDRPHDLRRDLFVRVARSYLRPIREPQ
ncbi:TetR/AcrR family transcriptional regulator [Rhodococcus rhodnii]|uniref:Transcriptional regulator n=1 Tax=Rhodococcus rhodnii LMG 5362 TaxID=1273125 RepID=R7WNZ2_9NOCA|nr:TetR/AcrR family transcriptional regulator [Rhodococcus rhodnii]EOM77036.1 transcriptional regulator [Rhodococcus rhodnii LMG 5362]